MAISIPVRGAKPFPPFPVLSTRQEAFCRGFIATGNAAEAARRAGYAERSARQTGHALMERPHIVERVREVRLLWRETARRETGILLDRLEQAWAVAVAKGSPFMMLQVIRLQADLSGLSRRGRHRRADLWPLPDEDEFGELAAALEAMDDPDFSGTAQPGPLAAALHRRNGGAGAETAVEDGPAEDKAEAAPGIAPDIAPDDPAVFDDPPEEHYDAAPLSVPRTGPDLQKGDDDAVDAEENGWMYALRCGHDPIDPCSAEEMALWAENEARLAALRPGIDTWEMAPVESGGAPAAIHADA